MVIEEDEDELPMGFDEQYERMVKRQLGGMLDHYIAHIKGDKVPQNKQNSNMMDTVKEFSRLKVAN